MNKYILNLILSLFLMSFVSAIYAESQVDIVSLITNDNTPY